MTIKFGPAGIGGIKEAVPNLEMYHRLGLKACEIAFTYGAYIKKREDAVRIGKRTKELGIQLSIHAPYWINLNSSDKEKVEKSKERILECCKIGSFLGAKKVVFHPGYYGKSTKEQTYNKIRMEILNLQEKIKNNGWEIRLCPETTGRLNVFGSIEEIKKLSEDTGCSFCIDFAHILARYKSYRFREIKNTFRKYKEWHCHFSGIEHGEKGEKHHKRTSISELKKLFSNLPKKEITIINESPSPVEDSVLGLRLYKNI